MSVTLRNLVIACTEVGTSMDEVDMEVGVIILFEFNRLDLKTC